MCRKWHLFVPVSKGEPELSVRSISCVGYAYVPHATGSLLAHYELIAHPVRSVVCKQVLRYKAGAPLNLGYKVSNQNGTHR